MGRLLIVNGRVIDPATGFDEDGDVVVESGRVARVGGSAPRADGDRVFDAAGCLVCPGLIDPHVHLREPGGERAETIATGAAAAINGGFTTVCCMPNTRPALDTPELIDFVFSATARAGQARVFPIGAATKGREGAEPAEIVLMARAGAVGFSDDGDVIASAGVMRQVLQIVRQTGRAFMQHCQEPTLTRGASMNAGPVALRLGLTGWPAVAEELIIERDLRLNRDVGCRYHVQHISCAGSVDLVREARAMGQPVTAEASPHHLLLTDEACENYDTNAKMNPPLRTPRDVEAVRQGVADGTITVLATDHAPHPLENKQQPFDQAPFGIVGLECALPLYAKALVETGLIDWPRLIALMTIEPARLCGLDAEPYQLGRLAPGAPADVTIIDPAETWTIRAADFVGRSRNTPFDGWQVTARAVGAIVNGHIRLDRHLRAS